MKNLKEIREERGVSQQELADMLQVSQKTVSSWECGYRNPGTKKMQQIEDIFKIPKEEIFYAAFNYKT